MQIWFTYLVAPMAAAIPYNERFTRPKLPLRQLENQCFSSIIKFCVKVALIAFTSFYIAPAEKLISKC